MILSLVYYRCPMLCSEVMAGLSGSLKALKFDVGKEFDVITVSFDPKDTPEAATAKKADYIKRYGRPGAADGWHFLTGSQESITALTKAVGFGYEYDPKSGQFSHATAIMIVTPGGQAGAVLLRRGISAKGFAAGVDSGFAEQDWHAGRPGAAVLLPLRPDDREVRRHHQPRDSAQRRRHDSWAGTFLDHIVSPWAGQRPGS